MARPLKHIDPKKVARLAGIGCPPNEIAAVLDCEEKLIIRRFSDVVQRAADAGKKRVRSRLFQMAVNGNLGACIFLCKAWMGMRETDPVSINVSANAVATFGLSDQQQKQISRLAEQIQHRVFVREKPQPEAIANGNGNGDHTPPALN